jgi:hypothetical protein
MHTYFVLFWIYATITVYVLTSLVVLLPIE